MFDKLGMRKKKQAKKKKPCFILFLKLHSSVFLDLQYMLYEGHSSSSLYGPLLSLCFPFCYVTFTTPPCCELIYCMVTSMKKKKCIFGSNESRQLLNFPLLRGVSLWCYAWHRCHRESVSKMATVQSKKKTTVGILT